MKNLIAIFLLGALLLSGCQQVAQLINPAPTAVALVSAGQRSSEVIVEGRIMPNDNVDLFFTIAGKVDEIRVAEGDMVRKGDVLVRLGDRQSAEASVASARYELTKAQQAYDDLKQKASLAYEQAAADVIAAERALTEAQQKLDDLDTDDYQKKIDDADVKVNDAKDTLNDAQDEFDKYKDLDKDNADRKDAETKLEDEQNAYDQAVRERDRLINDRDKVRADAALAAANLDDLRLTRDARKDGPDPDDLALAQAAVDNTTAQLAAAQAALDKYDLTAPFDGKIVKVDLTLGEQVLPNRNVLALADFSRWYVETNDLTENDVVRISADKPATIIPDALQDVELTGNIESISDIYSEKSGDIIYKTKLLLISPDGKDLDARLRWGMTVEVRFPSVEP